MAGSRSEDLGIDLATVIDSGEEPSVGRAGPCPQGTSVVLAARYIPIGRVAVNMSAGAVGYSRRRFVGSARSPH